MQIYQVSKHLQLKISLLPIEKKGKKKFTFNILKYTLIQNLKKL